MPKVVLTRPKGQADALAQALRTNGRTVIEFPLLQIAPITDLNPLYEAIRQLDQYALVAFVSPNAIDAFVPHVAHWPEDMTFAVMGEGSRLALARHGISADNARVVSPLDPAHTDSETLVAALDLDALRGKSALIVRGETGREYLGDALSAAGLQVTQIAAYRRTAPVVDAAFTAELVQLLAEPNDWVITSSEALRWLVAQIPVSLPVDGVAKMQQQSWYFPHPRIAETARTLGLQHLHQTGSGDESLLHALQFKP